MNDEVWDKCPLTTNPVAIPHIAIYAVSGDIHADIPQSYQVPRSIYNNAYTSSSIRLFLFQ